MNKKLLINECFIIYEWKMQVSHAKTKFIIDFVQYWVILDVQRKVKTVHVFSKEKVKVKTYYGIRSYSNAIICCNGVI